MGPKRSKAVVTYDVLSINSAHPKQDDKTLFRTMKQKSFKFQSEIGTDLIRVKKQLGPNSETQRGPEKLKLMLIGASLNLALQPDISRSPKIAF